MAPTPNIEYANFTDGNRKAAAEFSIVRIKLARHIGSKYKVAMGSKAMEEMEQSTIVKPIRE